MGNRISAEKSAAKKTGVPYETWKRFRDQGKFWCYECRYFKGHQLFSVDKSRSSGKASICKSCASIRSIRSRYSLTKDDLRALDIGHCAICLRKGQKMEIDHNHATGKVRSLLCSRCNGALGQFCDDVDLLKEAIKYLEKHDG